MSKWKDLNINDEIFYVILNKDNIESFLNSEMKIKELNILNITNNNEIVIFDTDIFGDIELTIHEYNYDSYITSYLEESLIILSIDHTGIINELTKILRDLRQSNS